MERGKKLEFLFTLTAFFSSNESTYECINITAFSVCVYLIYMYKSRIYFA